VKRRRGESTDPELGPTIRKISALAKADAKELGVIDGKGGETHRLFERNASSAFFNCRAEKPRKKSDELEGRGRNG